jgi:hypothetical protein
MDFTPPPEPHSFTPIEYPIQCRDCSYNQFTGRYDYIGQPDRYPNNPGYNVIDEFNKLKIPNYLEQNLPR